MRSNNEGGDTVSQLYYETSDSLRHYGVLGQKWGVRRYQNKDGSLTAAGKKRYNDDSDKLAMAVASKVEAIRDLQLAKSRYAEEVAKNPKKANTKEVEEKIEKYKTAHAVVDYGMKYLSEKYKTVDFDIKQESKTGEAYVQSVLKDERGETYISEFYLGYRY